MVRKVRRAIPLAAAIVTVGWLLSPGSGVSQEQTVVFSQVVVSGEEASLLVELDNGEELSAEISGGEIRLNGEILGRYGSADEMESSWRGLLSQAISTDPEDLPALLRGWTLPEELGDQARAGAGEAEGGQAVGGLEDARDARAQRPQAAAQIQPHVGVVVHDEQRRRFHGCPGKGPTRRAAGSVDRQWGTGGKRM